jgi:hypothetical protein
MIRSTPNLTLLCNEGEIMRLRVGCGMAYELWQAMPIIASLNVHSSRVSGSERPDYLVTTSTHD